ncbi:hypothetical protein JXJ21_12965 [candidate division KSB1 bacterium]|nr:hypothetical protein [candidate division KSB1 bacterium]
MMKNNSWKIAGGCILSSLCILCFSFDAIAQWDSSTPRYLTRSKLWATYRSTGLQGGQGQASSSSNDQACLGYPGSSIRAGEFTAYWNAAIINQSSGGGGAGAQSPNAARNENSHGEGTYILALADNTKFISYSGPRTISPDVVKMLYDAGAGPEADLGIDDAKSTYWPGAPFPPDPPDSPIEIHNYQYHQYIGRDDDAEEIMIVKWTTGMGITATKKAKSWSYQKYDDFIIVENVFEYTGDSNGDGVLDSTDVFGTDLPVLTGVYFSFANMLTSSLQGETWGEDPVMSWSDWRNNSPPAQDDIYKYSDSPGYQALLPEDTQDYIGKKMSYNFDGDDPDNDYNDTGEPYVEKYVQRNTGNEQQGQSETQLLSYAFIGMAPLDCDPTDGFANDNNSYVAPETMDQPSRCKWWPMYRMDDKPLEPNLQSFTEDEIYDLLTLDDPANDNPAVHPDPPSPDALRLVGLNTHFQVYGPYTMQPGDKVKIVIAYLGGSGADYLANQGVYDPKLAPENAWARSLNPGKMKEYEYGERSLFHNLSLAQELYDMEYDVPDPPPDVLIQDVIPNPKGHLQVFWSDEALEAEDPDYAGEEAKDVAGFRVYKLLVGGASDKADPNEPRSDDKLTGNWHNGPYAFMDEIRKGQAKSDLGLIVYNKERHQYVFTDVTTRAGAFLYFYSVRTFDTGHNDWKGTGKTVPSLESGLSAPEQKMLIGKEAYQLSSKASDQMEQTIRVVPNPYKKDGVHEYTQTNAIKFFNVPQKCTISIYSVSGELVARTHHDEASPLGEWDQQTVKFAGDIAPGIYFWVVESEIDGSYSYISAATGDTLPPVQVNSKGKTQKGTLLIIR